MALRRDLCKPKAGNKHLIGMVRVGTAGWTLPVKPLHIGTHLCHYARTLSCAEINSSFYRTHRAATWARWAAETPPGFRFSIKAPKTITHEARLRSVEPLLRSFLEQIEPLGEKAGPLLFQLPPKLAYDAVIAEDVFASLRELYNGQVVVEPRHATWFNAEADTLLDRFRVARVAADPPAGSEKAAEPGGHRGLVYYRLHGSPRTYYSEYSKDFLARLARRVVDTPDTWVIFDNTALKHAYANAIQLRGLLVR